MFEQERHRSTVAVFEQRLIADLRDIYQIEAKRQLLAAPLRVAVVGLQRIRVGIRRGFAVIANNFLPTWIG